MGFELMDTPGTWWAFVTHTERLSVSGFDDAVESLKARVKNNARLYHEITGGPGSGMIFLVDVDVVQVCGDDVSRTIYTFRDEGVDPSTMHSVLGGLGSTRVERSYLLDNECRLLTALRDLNAGKPSSIQRILCVKDETRSDLLYVSDRQKAMEWLESLKPNSFEPDAQIRILCEAPASHHSPRFVGHYSPRSELAPFIEAELAKQGVVFKKE